METIVSIGKPLNVQMDEAIESRELQNKVQINNTGSCVQYIFDCTPDEMFKLGMSYQRRVMEFDATLQQ
jgi:hypothetical protein